MANRLRNHVKVLPVLNATSVGYPDLDTMTVIHKFGRNADVGTSLEPVTISGIYRTPTAAKTLEILSDDTNDKSSGTGARSVRLYGLVGNWVAGNTVVSLNGGTAVAIDTDFLRVWRMKVESSGSYATQTTSSQKGTITVRESGGGATWAVLDEAQAGYGVGQSQIGAYSVPSGKAAFVPWALLSVDSGKTASVYFFVREGSNTTTAPVKAMQLKEQFDGLKGAFPFEPETPLGPYIGPCDMGFFAKVATTAASVTVDFTIWEFDWKTT